VSGIFQAALVAFLSFGGFDMVAAAGEEIRKPEKNLPRAILITLFGVLALYLAVAFVTLGTINSTKLGHSLSPLADAAGAFGGPMARHLIVFCALLTTAATANAILVVTSRTVFAMARDRLLPAPLATVHEATGIPWIAVLLNGLLILGVAAFGTVTMSSSTGGFLYVLHFLPPLIALVALRRDRSQPKPAFSTPWPGVLVPLAVACSLGLLVASGVTGATIGSTWLLIGVVLYASHLHRRRTKARTAVAQSAAAGGRPGLMTFPSPDNLVRPADSATRRHDVHLGD
jgi:APA family basic amino acid/polyamine antiporter